MIIKVLAGLISGIISGMGIGGGTILIPVLTLVLGIGQREAQCINLIYFIPTAIVAIIRHSKNKAIETSILKSIIIFGIIGSIIGSLFAVYLRDSILKKMFGIFLLIMGIYEIYKGKRCKANLNKEDIKNGNN